VNIKPFTGPGSTPVRRRFWDDALSAVLSARKLAGQQTSVAEHWGAGTIINYIQEPRTPGLCPGGNINIEDWFNVITVTIAWDVTCDFACTCIQSGSLSRTYTRINVIDTSFVPGGVHPEVDVDSQFAIWQNDVSGACNIFLTPQRFGSGPFPPGDLQAYGDILVNHPLHPDDPSNFSLGDSSPTIHNAIPGCGHDFNDGTFPPVPDEVFPSLAAFLGTHVYTQTVAPGSPGSIITWEASLTISIS
jgi:hypothetical protein